MNTQAPKMLAQELIEAAINRALKARDDDSVRGERWIQLDIAFAKELAKLAETYGLVNTLRSLHAYHVEHPLPQVPLFLELFLLGEVPRRDGFRSYTIDQDKLLKRHGFFPLCWQFSIENLEHKVAYVLFGEVVVSEITAAAHKAFDAFVRGRSEGVFSLRSDDFDVKDLAKCQIPICNEVSLALPEWEAVAILEGGEEYARRRLDWFVACGRNRAFDSGDDY